MKISFSTLACPNWTLNEILTAAKDLGYDGIEIRGLGDELFAPALKLFDEKNLDKTRGKFEALNLGIAILSSAAPLGEPLKSLSALDEARAYAALAGKLGVRYIRVLFTPAPSPAGGDTKLFTGAFTALCNECKALNVTPLVETNGLFSDTALLKEVFEAVGSANKGILWDVNHTFRYNGESVDTTVGRIGKYIRHVHLKDSVMTDGKPVYKMVGYGDVPVFEAVKKLNSLGYSGYYSLEWVKRWEKELEEPGIVLAHFIDALRSLR